MFLPVLPQKRLKGKTGGQKRICEGQVRAAEACFKLSFLKNRGVLLLSGSKNFNTEGMLSDRSATLFHCFFFRRARRTVTRFLSETGDRC